MSQQQLKQDHAQSNTYWKNCITHLGIVGEHCGECNMVLATSEALERMQESEIDISGDAYFDTEIYKNRDFAQKLVDLVGHACDLNYVKHTKFERLEKLRELKADIEQLMGEI